MNINTLLESLKEKKVLLANEENQLKVYSNRKIPRSMVAGLRQHKERILEILDNNSEQKDEISSYDDVKKLTKNPDRNDFFQMTEMQQAYWIGRNGGFGFGNRAANIYAEFVVDPLDILKLEEAWNLLLIRYEILRANLQQNGTLKINQTIPYYHFETLDLDRTIDKEDSKLQSIREEFAYKVRCNDSQPLFDIGISRLTEEKNIVHVSLDSIIIDMQSFTMLTHEWSVLSQNLKHYFPARPSFEEYTLQLAHQRNQSKYHRAKSYWVDRVVSLPKAPKFPLLKKTDEQDTSISSMSLFFKSLNQQEWEKVRTLASESKTTPTACLLGLYTEVISFFAEEAHYLLNVTISDRKQVFPDVDKVIGNFTNILPLEVNQRKNTSFLNRVDDLKKQLLSDFDQRHFSGIEVMREINKKTHSSQILPVVFTSSLGGSNSSEVNSRSKTVRKGEQSESLLDDIYYQCNPTPQVLIHNYLYETKNGIDICIEIDKSAFNQGFDSQFYHYYQYGLQSIIDQRFDNLLGMQFNKLLPEQYKKSEVDFQNLYYLFLNARTQFSDKPAIITSHKTITYEELQDRALALANDIYECAPPREAPIAIVMNKGWEQVIAVYGILFAGYAYLPIDASLPKERQKVVLRHSDVSLCVTQNSVKDSLFSVGEMNREFQCIVVQEHFCGNDLGCSRITHVDSNQLAYVIYTSGSTGKPKGVMISHASAINTLVDINRRFNVSSDDRILALSSLSFDLSVFDIFGALAVGGAIVLPDPEKEKDPGYLYDFCNQHKVTIWNSVPALFDRFMMRVRQNTSKLDLRLILLSGDWIPLDLASFTKTHYPGIELVSLGGATEASIWSIFHVIEEIDPHWTSIPYGKALSDQSIYVLDDSFRPRPVGVPGELFIGGRGVAMGYHNDQELTEERFVVHPNTGERIYKTGDLGRYQESEEIEILGRTDFQVKVNGYRVELEEIESSMTEICGISRSLVIPKKDAQSGLTYLVAFYISGTNFCEGQSREIEIRKNLSAKLPSYMVPHLYFRLPNFPLSPNGKVDRKALNEIDIQRPKHNVEHDFTQSKEITDLLLKIMEEEGEFHNIDPNASFFELGMTSIHVLFLKNKIEEALNIELEIVRLFQYPTTNKMSSYLAQNLLRDNVELSLDKSRHPKENKPISRGQMRRQRMLTRRH